MHMSRRHPGIIFDRRIMNRWHFPAPNQPRVRSAGIDPLLRIATVQYWDTQAQACDDTFIDQYPYGYTAVAATPCVFYYDTGYACLRWRQRETGPGAWHERARTAGRMYSPVRSPVLG